MAQFGHLPVTNGAGFFEVRLESIGGLGANLAGKILAEAGVLHAGLNASNFASYGSEKKGSPVKSHIRFASGDHPIRQTEPVERPHVLGVFHEALLRSSPDAVSGASCETTIIVNSRRSPEEVRKQYQIPCGMLGVLPALDIAVAEGSRVNMAMLGALARACHFIPLEAFVEALQQTVGARYPKLFKANLNTFRRGYEEVKWVPIAPVALPDAYRRRATPVVGYETAPRGGAILQPGNTIHKDLSASRQGFLPEFLRDRCIDCGQCDLVCPDFCFVWEEGRDKRGRPAMALQGIDYQYCKGCLKCVEACPVHALVTVPELDGWAELHRVPHVWHQLERL